MDGTTARAVESEGSVTSVRFERTAALCAMVNAMTGFLYALAFTAVSAARRKPVDFLVRSS
jgi:hypothetical protein